MCLGIPMKVTELVTPGRAMVESGDVSMLASLELVDDVSVGDYVIVHAGFAIEVLDPEAACETLSLLREIAREGYDGAATPVEPGT